MKLHKISWNNLNSLYGPGELDLDRELGGASLFLVTGPTGAGKSTLMDAVSLALFGTTPRLDLASSDTRVDAREVMSRGTGTASAELEFSKLEGGRRLRFRARWAVHRSRNKADRALQRPRRSLERLEADGTWAILVSDHRAKHYDEAFREVLEGFTVEDFQRSMLLAQGQFDAFLKAKPEARAEILERLTDTAIYRQLGERAARMNRAHTQHVAELATQLRTLAGQGLAPEELATTRLAWSALEAKLAEIHAQVLFLEPRIRWLEEHTAHCGELEQARVGVAGVNTQRKQHGAALRSLAEHERCADALSALDKHDAARLRAETTCASLALARQALPSLLAAEREAERIFDDAERTHTRARAGLERLRTPVDSACLREAELAGATHELQVATTTRATAATVEARSRTAEQQAGDRELVAAAAAAEAKSAVHAHLADAALVPELGALGQATGTVVQQSADLALRGEQLVERARRLTDLQQALNNHTAALARHLEGPLAEAERGLVAAGATLAAIARGEAPAARLLRLKQSARDALGQARRAIKATQPLSQAASDAARVVVRQNTEADAGAALSTLRNAAERAAAAQRTAREQLTLAKTALEGFEQMAGLLAYRELLVDGEACPLCGGNDHAPTALAAEEQIAARLADARSEVTRREQLATTAQGAATEAASTLRLGENTLGAAVRERKTTEARAAASSAQAETLRVEAGLPEGATALLAQQVASHQTNEHSRLEAERQQLEATQRDRDRCLATAQKERTHREGLDLLRDHGAHTLRSETELHDRASTSIAQERAALLTAVEALRHRFEGLGVDVSGEPEAWLSRARSRAHAHEARVERATAADHALTTARTALAVAATATAGAAQAAQHAAVLHTQRTEAHREAVAHHAAARATLEAVWHEIVATDPPHTARPRAQAAPRVLEADQQARVDRTESAVDTARVVRSAGAAAVVQGREVVSERTAQLETASAEADHAAAELDARLSATELPNVSSLRAKRLDAAELGTLVRLRERLVRAMDQAVATVAAAEQRLARHVEATPASLSAAADLGFLTELAYWLEANREEVQERADAVRFRLLQHEQTQAACEAGRQALAAAQEQAAIWIQLHSLIGRGDGQAFKQFAQALNLGHLLAKANAHLARLTDRYALAPHIDADTGLPTLDFVIVDRWQLGGSRSPRTLSGGESFQVSLALALGLSDLRTVSMPIETLMLDEGFGTLDPTTLDAALAALQQLQASGRQVGVISHVHGLQDRIDARVVVEPIGGGRSTVRVMSA